MKKLFIILTVILIGAFITQAADVSFEWEANAEPDLAGYTIYWGMSTRDYSEKIDVEKVTEYKVTGLDSEAVYYFAITAYDEDNNESDYSNELIVFFKTPEIISPAENTKIANVSQEFCWDDNGIGASEWWIHVGSGTVGSSTKDIHNSGTIESSSRCYTAGGLPLTGNKFYLTLWYKINEDWDFVRASYETEDLTAPGIVKNFRKKLNVSDNGIQNPKSPT